MTIKNFIKFLHLMRKNKKGISPIIAIILLLMMTVAVAGAAFFWLSRIQNQLQGGVESFQGTIFTQVSSAVDVISANCEGSSTDPCQNLTVILQNTGNTEIPLKDTGEFPTTTWILRDENQAARCSTNWNASVPNVGCIKNCGATNVLEVGQITDIKLNLTDSACEIVTGDKGKVFSFTADFSGKTTGSGSFVIPST